MMDRTGWEIRCGKCRIPFAVFTTKSKGQFLCNICGHRPRADFRGGQCPVTLSGPYEYRSEAINAALMRRIEEAGANV
jgi:hypothetical protein